MFITIDPKWHWYAQDAEGSEWLFEDKPRYMSDGRWISNKNAARISSIGRMLPVEIAATSLKAIINNMPFRAPAPVDTLVMVKTTSGKWLPRYSAGELAEDGNLIVWAAGATSKTSKAKGNYYTAWKPYEEGEAEPEEDTETFFTYAGIQADDEEEPIGRAVGVQAPSRS